MYTPSSPHRLPTRSAATRPCTKKPYCSGSTKNAIIDSPCAMRQGALLGHMLMGQGAISDKRQVALMQHHHVGVIRLTQDGGRQDRVRWSLSDDAMLKAHHPWHMAGNGIEVMRGQEDGHALAIQLMQEVQNIVLGLQVHTGSRLIEQQEVGPGNQGAGEKDPL